MKPRIFVSSTFYDLKSIREDLYHFIRQYNYEPIESETGDIGYVPGQDLDKSCYTAMKDCDMAILIIGGRYGSAASDEMDEEGDYISITHKEFRTAVENGVPVYAFIEQAVNTEYELYKLNKERFNDPGFTFEFNSVDNRKVFKFISELRGIVGIPIHTFSKTQDIKDYGDEVAKWNKEVFQMLKSRLDKPYSCFDGSCNPEHPTHWLKEFLDNDKLDIYLQRYTIFDNPFLPPKYVEELCKEYEGTIYYDRLILGLWKRAEGAIYKRFADNPDAYRCEVLDELASDAEYKQFKKTDIVSIEIGLDFGGNQSGHSFVARGYTDDYADVISVMSKRIMAKDTEEDIDSNRLDELFCDFVQEVIDKYGVIAKSGNYVEYCNVESVYYDNAETVLGNSIRNAVEKRFPWITVRKARKAAIIDRIRCTVRLMGAGRFWTTDDSKSLQTAFSDAVWNKDVTDKDERLDDGSTDIDSLDAFEYTIERDMKDLIEEVEDV